jgi:hypothetical protein
LGGLLNVYGGRVRSDYTYASDSFGIWRFRPIHEVLLACDKPRLHILTHPILWSPDPLPVRRKIARCLAERAAAGQALYDHLVRSAGMWDAVMAQEDQEL